MLFVFGSDLVLLVQDVVDVFVYLFMIVNYGEGEDVVLFGGSVIFGGLVVSELFGLLLLVLVICVQVIKDLLLFWLLDVLDCEWCVDFVGGCVVCNDLLCLMFVYVLCFYIDIIELVMFGWLVGLCDVFVVVVLCVIYVVLVQIWQFKMLVIIVGFLCLVFVVCFKQVVGQGLVLYVVNWCMCVVVMCLLGSVDSVFCIVIFLGFLLDVVFGVVFWCVYGVLLG